MLLTPTIDARKTHWLIAKSFFQFSSDYACEIQASITDLSSSDHLTRNFTGMNCRVGLCLLLMVSRSGSSFKLISVAARFAELVDCTISSISIVKSRGIVFTLDSLGVNCE